MPWTVWKTRGQLVSEVILDDNDDEDADASEVGRLKTKKADYRT